MLIKLSCKTCEKEFEVQHWRAKSAKYCSRRCADLGLHASLDIKCPICGKMFHRKPYHQKRVKECYCSKDCLRESRRRLMSGNGNHQYGLKGHLNASHISKSTFRKNGQWMDEFVYAPSHPRAQSCGRVTKHRLVVEQNAHLFDDKYFEKCKGVTVLKKGIHVHHINGNHSDNRVQNLIPLTRGEHRSIHNREYAQLRQLETGRIQTTTKALTQLDKLIFYKVNPMKIGIKSLDDAPRFATTGSAGADMKASADIIIPPHNRALISTGVRVELPPCCAAYVLGRSGNTIKRGLLVAFGLIDSDYRGEIGVMAFNMTDNPIEIKKGDRIAQLVVVRLPDVEFVEVDELTSTDRGEGGYGSTGK